MSKKLFPSGRTLTDVKKDAKLLRYSENIKHNDALLLSASRNGIEASSWNEVLLKLDKYLQSPAFAEWQKYLRVNAPRNEYFKVPRPLLRELGIAAEISEYSLILGEFVYIADKRDSRVLKQAMRSHGRPFKFKAVAIDKTEFTHGDRYSNDDGDEDDDDYDYGLPDYNDATSHESLDGYFSDGITDDID